MQPVGGSEITESIGSADRSGALFELRHVAPTSVIEGFPTDYLAFGSMLTIKGNIKGRAGLLYADHGARRTIRGRAADDDGALSRALPGRFKSSRGAGGDAELSETRPGRLRRGLGSDRGGVETAIRRGSERLGEGVEEGS